MKLNIGTRGSNLAIAQTNYIMSLIVEKNPIVEFNIDIIKTTGDKILDVPLGKIGGKGIFVKEIDEALLNGKIDLAVHSMKDIPTDIIKNLEIVSVPTREDSCDVLISNNNINFDDLPKKSIVGTSSIRRQAEILFNRNDLCIKNIRGNIETRLKKLNDGRFDALIMAHAGLKRLGFENIISQKLSKENFLPAVGQGAIGIVAQSNSEHRELFQTINDERSMQRIFAERALLKHLGGGCQVPIGVCTYINQELYMKAAVFSSNGKRKIETEVYGKPKDYNRIGIKCAKSLIDKGGNDILVKFL